MKVVIKERECSYESDFPKGWKFISGDEFKYPVTINGHLCFIKRFKSKRPENISGWQLMTTLKGLNVQGFPRIYDIVNAQENGRNVNYVFYEYLDGETLDKLIEARKEIDLQLLSDGIFQSFETLKEHGYWFIDFCEKNIFCTDTKYFLVDIDSTQEISEPLDNGAFGNKDYWILVFDFYRKILGEKLQLSSINGINFNYLQLVFLLLRLKLFYGENYREYNAHELFDKLPASLNDLSPAYRDFFYKALNDKDTPFSNSDLGELKALVKKTIIDYDGSPASPSKADEPFIEYFKADAKEDSDGIYHVKSQKPFTVSWYVQNANQIELLKNGEHFKDIEEIKGSEQFSERAYDGKSKEIKYTLRTGEGSISNEKSLTIIVESEQVPELQLPIVKTFIADKKMIGIGEPFKLSWTVYNSGDIELLKNGVVSRRIFEHEGNISLTSTVNDVKQKKIVYELQAYNSAGKIKSDPLEISVLSQEPPPVKSDLTKKILIGAGALLLLFLAILFYPKKKAAVEMFSQTTVTDGDTVVFAGKNLPSKEDIEVDFNYARADILSQSDDKLVVKVPALADLSDHVKVKVYVKNILLAIKDSVTYLRRRKDLPAATTPLPVAIDSTFTPTDTTTVAVLTPKTRDNKIDKNGKTKTTKSKSNKKEVVQVVEAQQPTVQEEPKKPAINMHDYISVSANDDYKHKLFGGVTKLAVILNNKSDYDIQSATVEISYLKGDKVVKTETVKFATVKAKSSASMGAPGSGKGSKVATKLLSVSTKEFGNQ
ncbi:IPT/TIG domain-containing protein [Pinibacter aurantiacus]|uniref:IPT/TIG domain-containing protein n=1 Tax=Pinibacter aurantiacus TaxID=2851599 RepID=A0A9E2SEW8_9BACT|nr:IPT/TIG domain-containing protein [Pinibacter aurantiacus]MBV4360549.1 hypothetical protein [Pinibacter aurantiacus]